MAMREIVLDVETTGLYAHSHRVIEIACIELDRYQPTGRIFHRYVNPLLARMPESAFEIHRIPIEFLWHHAPFFTIADSLLEFIGDDQLVIHNAAFDIAFINAELALMQRPPLRNQYLDTLAMARETFKGASNSLDALCRRFGIDLTIHRKRHGAMIDCALLANVYFELIGGKSPLMELPVQRREENVIALNARPMRPARPHPPLSIAEENNFTVMLSRLKSPIWRGGKQLNVAEALEIDDEIPF